MEKHRLRSLAVFALAGSVSTLAAVVAIDSPLGRRVRVSLSLEPAPQPACRQDSKGAAGETELESMPTRPVSSSIERRDADSAVRQYAVSRHAKLTADQYEALEGLDLQKANAAEGGRWTELLVAVQLEPTDLDAMDRCAVHLPEGLSCKVPTREVYERTGPETGRVVYVAIYPDETHPKQCATYAMCESIRALDIEIPYPTDAPDVVARSGHMWGENFDRFYADAKWLRAAIRDHRGTLEDLDEIEEGNRRFVELMMHWEIAHMGARLARLGLHE